MVYSFMVFSFLFRPLFWLVVLLTSATIEARAVTRFQRVADSFTTFQVGEWPFPFFGGGYFSRCSISLPIR